MKLGNTFLALCAVGLLVAAGPAQAISYDSLTGQPIPALDRPVEHAGAVPHAPEQLRDGLTLVAHLAEGATKEVRALDDTHIVFQNGAYLEFYDVTDPTAPVSLARYLMAAQPSDMVVDGTTLWVALRKDQGLLALDVSDPAAPAALGQLTGYDMLSVGIDTGYAYCGLGSAGFVVVDISDPAAMTAVNTTDTPGSANGTWVAGDVLLVAQGNDGLGTFDISFPSSPAPLGSFATPSFCTYVMERDGLAYLTGGFGLTIVDVSTPASPVLVGNFSTDGSTTYEVALDGDNAWICGLDGGRRVSVADPAAPTEQAFVGASQGLSVAVTPDAGLAFLAERFQGLHTLTADTLTPQSLVHNAGFAMKLHLAGPYLYVIDLAGGLRIFDVTDPANPVFMSDTETPGNSQDCAIMDGVAYTVNSDASGEGLYNLDVSDPSAPSLLGTLNTNNQAFGIDLQDDLAYVANGFGGILVADVASPAAPSLLGEIFFGANCFDVKVDGTVGYTALFGGGMASVDVTDPASMSIIDQEITWGFLNALDLTPPLAWVADGQFGLRIVDIGDPGDLVTLGLGATASQARDVVENGYVYVADDFYGLRQFDVSDPTAPQLVGSVPSADRGIGVDAEGQTVVLAAGETGVYVFEAPPVAVVSGGLTARRTEGAVAVDIRCSLAEASDLRVERQAPGADRTWTAGQFEALREGPAGITAQVTDREPVAGEATYRLVLDTDGATRVLAEARVDVATPAAVRLTAAPNPFNPQLQIKYALPQAGHVRVEIYDVRGHAVRTIDLGERPAGEGSLIWDGTDATGRACASGVYQLRLQAGPSTVSQPVTLVR